MKQQPKPQQFANLTSRSAHKSLSQQSRDPPPSTQKKSNLYSQTSIQSASATNMSKYQNLNQNPKTIQPVLRQKEDAFSHNSNSSAQKLALQKSNSGSIDKKVKPVSSSGVQPNTGPTKLMKEQAFVYQEQPVQVGTPNRQLFKKTASETKTLSSKSKVNQIQTYDDEFIEVMHQDESIEETKKRESASKISKAIERPSDEVQYQELLMGEDKESSLGGSIVKGSQIWQLNQSNSKFSPEVNNGRYKAASGVKERNQSQGKDLPYKNINHMKIDESGFKVHEELSRGSNTQEDRLVPIDSAGKVATSPFARPNDIPVSNNPHFSKPDQRNSDFKRFNMEEELQNQQALRVARQADEEFKEQSKFSKGNNRYEESPNDIKQNTSFEESKFNKVLPTHSSENQSQQFSPNQFKSNDYEQDLQQQQNMSPNSYNSPPLSMEEQHYPGRREQLLSFADKSQMYMEYPPLQINENVFTQTTQEHNQSIPLSPTAARQQQRLQDILKTSKGDVSQLQNALSSQKIDEQSLNSMIDMEKNYVIMQYEGILQQLNVEFHRLLQKSKDMEEQLSQKEQFIKTQHMIVQDKEELLFQQEQVCRQLKNQVQDLVADSKINTQRNVAHEVENYRMERDLQEQKIHSMQSQMKQFQSVEEDLREQLESLQSRLRSAEQQLRSKEESLFSAEREKQRLNRDLKNMGDIESQLREELKLLNQSRTKLEDSLQEEKQKVFACEIGKRQREMELENVIRDNRSLKATIDVLQQSQQEVSQENQQIKSYQTESEREKIALRSQLEKQERENSRLISELKKVKMALQQAQEELEGKSYQTMGEAYTRHSPQRAQNQYYSGREEEEGRGKVANLKQGRQYENDYSQKPLQEQNTNYYSPDRNMRSQPQLHQYSSPNMIEGHSTKQSIVWVSQSGTTDSDNRNKSSFNQSSEPHSLSQRRKTNTNQNESQLQEFFQWPSTQRNQPTQQNTAQIRSLERQNNKNPYQQFAQNNAPAQQVVESVWTKGKSPLAQYSQPVAPAFNKQQQQDSAMQAAGKKSTVQINQSPLQGKNNKNFEQQLVHMQNSLSSLQIDKEMLENEFRRIGGHPKNKQQIEKKQSVEMELEIVNKNIQNLKQKLRELNAF